MFVFFFRVQILSNLTIKSRTPLKDTQTFLLISFTFENKFNCYVLGHWVDNFIYHFVDIYTFLMV